MMLLPVPWLPTVLRCRVVPPPPNDAGSQQQTVLLVLVLLVQLLTTARHPRTLLLAAARAVAADARVGCRGALRIEWRAGVAVVNVLCCMCCAAW